jgi:hypothetical protein
MNSNKENKNVGTTTGIAVGFLGGAFTKLCIAYSHSYRTWRSIRLL